MSRDWFIVALTIALIAGAFVTGQYLARREWSQAVCASLCMLAFAYLIWFT